MASDPLPISVAVREGRDLILAMGFEYPRASTYTSFASLAGQTSNILVNNLLKASFSFAGVARHSEVIPIIPAYDREIGLRDLHLLPYIAEQGEKATEEQVPYLRRLMGEDSPKP